MKTCTLVQLWFFITNKSVVVHQNSRTVSKQRRTAMQTTIFVQKKVLKLVRNCFFTLVSTNESLKREVKEKEEQEEEICVKTSKRYLYVLFFYLFKIKRRLNSPSGQRTVFHSWWECQWSELTPQTWWKVVIWERSRVNSQKSTSGCRKLLRAKPPCCVRVSSLPKLIFSTW